MIYCVFIFFISFVIIKSGEKTVFTSVLLHFWMLFVLVKSKIKGKTSSKDYSLFDKLNMAIAEKVNGIIIASDGSDTINSLIVDAASQNDIDIISLMENDLGYGRNGFIGINNYDQGNAYGYLLSNIIGDKNELEVALLKPSSKQNHTLKN